MALTRSSQFDSGTVLTESALEGEFDAIYSGALNLISPLTGPLAAGDNDITGIDELAFTDAAANASVSGRTRRNSTRLTFHDGTAARNLVVDNDVATQAQMETATSTTTFVSPGRTQYHPGVAKAWGNWNNAGTIAASLNLSSVTDTGAGNHTANFTTAFTSGSYAAAVTRGDDVTDIEVHTSSLVAGSIQVLGRNVTTPFGLVDLTVWLLIVFGDQ